MRGKLKHYLTTGAIGVLLISAAACGSHPSAATDSTVTTEVTTEAESTTAEVPVPQWGDEEEQDLYSLYTELDSYILGRVDSALDRYFTYVEKQEEFARSGNYYTTYSISDYMKQDLASINKMLDKKPELSALDHSYLELYPQITAMIDVINRIEQYSDLSAFLDDDFAKGVEYHQELWGLYGSYQELAAQVREQYAGYSNSYLGDLLAQAEADDDEIYRTAISALLAAKAINAEFQAQGVTDENQPQADLERLQPLYDEFLIHVNTMLDQAKQPNAIEEQYFWDNYLDSVKKTKTSMTLILRNIKENKTPYTTSSIAGSDSIVSFRGGLTEMANNFDRWLKEGR